MAFQLPAALPAQEGLILISEAIHFFCCSCIPGCNLPCSALSFNSIIWKLDNLDGSCWKWLPFKGQFPMDCLKFVLGGEYVPVELMWTRCVQKWMQSVYRFLHGAQVGAISLMILHIRSLNTTSQPLPLARCHNHELSGFLFLLNLVDFKDKYFKHYLKFI